LILKEISIVALKKKMTPKTNTEKTNLHRINTDFDTISVLIENCPQLKSHVSINEHRIETIDFSD
jgi:23S rRNA (adenine1618-N6)-methyltransferase